MSPVTPRTRRGPAGRPAWARGGLWLIAACLFGCSGPSANDANEISPQRLSSWTACYDPASSRRIPVQREASPQIAALSDGSVLAVWIQCEGQTSNVWSSTYQIPSGWSPPQPIGSGADDRWPALAVNARDQATVLWLAGSRIWEAQYDRTSGFGPARTVDLGNFETPAVYMRDDGDAVAVWPLRSPTATTIRASRRIGGTWTDPETLDIGPGDLFFTSTADAAGTLTVAWSNPLGLWTARLGFASNWSGIELLGDGRAQEPRISGRPQGGATLVFWQGGTGAIFARVLAPNGGWGAPARLNGEDYGQGPQVDLGAQSGVAAWHTQGFVWADRQFSNGSWGQPQRLGAGQDPVVVSDNLGNAAAAFVVSPSDGFFRLDLARQVVEGSWSAAEPARPGSAVAQLGRAALVIANGVVHVVWAEQVQPHGTPDTVELWSVRRSVR